ncbi:hypothetical protein B0J11DRAFT_254944 [Dendryphion nanum]|uniref:Fucose-specific lectin n=1 Tax=Dendryphion nanum TaxID=256645 RepID=A0A9P9E5Z7_9PLEO|nr:hypothetical protein B0J11DRAFT_254944 [Dendryphion nanum]
MGSEQPNRGSGMQRRIFGVLVWVYITMFLLSGAIIVIGVVIGVILPQRNAPQSSVTDSNIIQGTPTETSPSRVSGTSTGTNVPAATPRESLKYSSIAVSRSETGHIQVFYMKSNTIGVAISGDKGWKTLEPLSPSIIPKPASPLAAVSWKESGADKIRLYYYDNSNRMVEYSGLCRDDGTACTWGNVAIVVPSGISPHSSIAAVQWGNSTSGTGDVQIRTFFEDVNGEVNGGVYSYGWNTGNGYGKILPGSRLVATIESPFAPPVFRVWYIDPNMSLKRAKWDNGFAPTIDIPIRNTSSLDPYAAIASANEHVVTGSKKGVTTHTYIIQSDGIPIEISSLQSSEYSYATKTQTGFPKADVVGGSIAALGWKGPSNLYESRVYYAVGGAIQEMALKDGAWIEGATVGA